MKQTIQQHRGDLEATETACAELQVGQDEAAAGTQSSTSLTGRKRQKGVESEILQSLEKRVAESGSILKDFTKAQQQPMTARAAFANYDRDSLMTMPKASYNRLLSDLMENSDNASFSPGSRGSPYLVCCLVMLEPTLSSSSSYISGGMRRKILKAL